MRKVVYSVAMSLDGYIARRSGEYDWIPEEPAIDWDEFLDRFDTVLMGRKTYEVVERQGSAGPTAGMRTIVFSETLEDERHPEAEVVAGDAARVIGELREEEGKDLWLMGGGELFRSLLEAGLVDEVEVAVVPILLGGGIRFLPPTQAGASLELKGTTEYPSGLVVLSYEVST